MRINGLASRMVTAEEHEASLRESGMTKEEWKAICDEDEAEGERRYGSASMKITANADDARIAKEAKQAGITVAEHQKREDKDI
jgi:hypothetical protein